MNMLELQIKSLMRQPKHICLDVEDKIRDIVEYIHREGNVSMKVLVQQFELSHTTISRYLEESLNQGKLKKFRVGNVAYYCNPSPAPRRK